MRSFSVYSVYCMYYLNGDPYKNRTALVAGDLRLSFEMLLRDSNTFSIENVIFNLKYFHLFFFCPMF